MNNYLEDEWKCGECRYWDRIDGEAASGHCKRYPPQTVVFVLQERTLEHGVWPKTYYHNRCGEFVKNDRVES